MEKHDYNIAVNCLIVHDYNYWVELSVVVLPDPTLPQIQKYFKKM